MTALSDFLLARIAEDEAVAREALPDEDDAAGGAWGEYGEFANRQGNPAVALAFRYSPTRVLAECETKRRIVEQWREVDEIRRNHDDDPDLYCELADGHVIALDQALRHLTLPYADRPGFREEWTTAKAGNA